jgi:drug/metabolite transporter (DMT)-like permease
MSLLALLMLLVAAVLHAAWNLLARGAADRQASLWSAMVVGSSCLLPFLVQAWPPPPEAVVYALGSSLFEVAYFLLLLAAYAAGDFSLVYPVARGSAPLLIALWAALFLGERPSLLGWVGIGLVVLGLIGAGAPNAEAAKPGEPRRERRALLLALATGLSISGYSLVNKVGLAYIAAPAFTALFHLGTTLLLAPYLIWSRGRRLLLPWRQDVRRTIGIGLMLSMASTLVLGALSIERASYVGAVREVSVVVGALAGWLLLGEPLGARRTLASTTMFAGLALIATLG